MITSRSQFWLTSWLARTSAGGPSSESSATPNRDPVRKPLTMSMSCSTNTEVTFCFASAAASISMMPNFSAEATPEVGSSISSKRGFSASASAMSTSLRCPSGSSTAMRSGTERTADEIEQILPSRRARANRQVTERRSRRPRARRGGNQHVLKDGMLEKELRNLKRTRDAETHDVARRKRCDFWPSKLHSAGLRPEIAGGRY